MKDPTIQLGLSTSINVSQRETPRVLDALPLVYKREWELDDYPVVIREQRIEPESERSPSRGVQERYLARMVNWWVLTGGGDTPSQAMADLLAHFGRMKDSRQRDGKPMPRPGAKVPIEFAPSTRVSSKRMQISKFRNSSRITGNLDTGGIPTALGQWSRWGRPDNVVRVKLSSAVLTTESPYPQPHAI